MAYSNDFSTTLITLVDDLVSAEKMTMSEMLYEAAFENSDVASSHEVVTGVRHGHTVPILRDVPQVDSFPFVDPNNCVITDCDVTHAFSSMSWELGLLECRVGICLRTFDENFLKFFNAWRHTQEGEPNLDSAILQFINGQFLKNHQIAQWRASYFGDKASASALYNGINGFFVQGQANAANVITVTENAGIDAAGQVITGEAVYNYLISMYDQAAAEPWFDPAVMEYRVTKSMASKLVTWLNNQNLKAPSNCTCIDAKTAVGRPYFMIEGLMINGIPIMTHNEWDTIINYSTELNGGGGTAARVDPHRAILTHRQNLLIGTSETAALASFDIWYDKTDKKVYLEGSSYLGAAIPMDEYVLAI